MIIHNKNVFTEIKDCSTLNELYDSREQLSDAVVVLVHGNGMTDEISAEAAEWLMKVPFAVVFAAEKISGFSYEFLSLFDVRLSREKYPASAVKADERYRVLCGDTAYFALCSGGCADAPNFVTVLDGEENFSDEASVWTEKICGGKTSAQLKVLVNCLTAVRRSGIDAVLSAESEGFYELMAQKTEGKSDE